MTESSTPGVNGWFGDLDPDDVDGATDAITGGTAEEPREWPQLAVEAGFVDSVEEYYDLLRDATVRATTRAVEERQRADDRQLIERIRAMDDCERVANELAERVAAWAGTRFEDAGAGVDYARELAGLQTETGPSERTGRRNSSSGATENTEEETVADEALRSLAGRVADLADEADRLRRDVERTSPAVAPNLSALAGPVLAARLVALAGGLEALAKKPSGTVQVLGAEDALFAHLRGEAPSPKHGVIFLHEYVANTDPAHRGSAARAVAGKLTIAARVDHYSGERKPELADQLDGRIARIRSRTEDDDDDADDDIDADDSEDAGDDNGDDNGDDVQGTVENDARSDDAGADT